MTADHYAAAGRGWATGAELVHGPIAAELIALSPHPLAGHTVLDAGAGTREASRALPAQPPGPSPWTCPSACWPGTPPPGHRAPGAVADIRALPLAAQSVGDAVAAFVLNHLTDPSAGLAELARVTRPGGAVLAAVFGTTSGDPARGRIDTVAQDAGWQIPAWYAQLKTTAVPILGSAAMAIAAPPAGGPSGRTAADRRASRGR
jgi:SAM-dependent methyltransferase